jgi:hypothetical protein
VSTDTTSRKKASIRRRAAVVALVSAALVAPVVTAAPALAWSGSSTVTLTGNSGCWADGPQQATVYGELNTQGHTSVQFGMPARYSVTFTNVPSGGGWAWFTVHCSVGGDHNRWVRVYRPGWGSTLSVNL